MASQGPKISNYARRMDRLSKQIFGEPWKPADKVTARIPGLYSQLPVEKNERFNTKYYPPHPMFFYLFKMLRLHGIYRDEHLDFVEEQERLRKLRGKGRPERGEGKRALRNK